MARFTFEMAYLKAEKCRRELSIAEDNYINTIEKILRREHFKDGHLAKKPELSSLSKMELQISFNKLQKLFIEYTLYSELSHKLEKGHLENVKLPKYK